MITNLEWLYANDRDALIDMAASDNCDYCLVNECDGEDSMTYEMCADFRKEWFTSEYAEEKPDSWEKVEKECEMDSWDYCEKYNLHFQQCLSQTNDINALKDNAPIRMKKHIVFRCKKLAGVE